MTMKKNIFIVAFLILSVSVFAQRDSVVPVTTAYITPLNTGLPLQDEEEEDDFLAEMNKPVEQTYKLDTTAAKTSNADKFDDLFS